MNLNSSKHDIHHWTTTEVPGGGEILIFVEDKLYMYLWDNATKPNTNSWVELMKYKVQDKW